MFPFLGCGSVVNNTLKSPGYPNKYPFNMNCIYLVPIPRDMTMSVHLEEFNVEHDRSCRYVASGALIVQH